MTEQEKRIEEAKTRISIEAVNYAQDLQFTGGYKTNKDKQLAFVAGGLDQLEYYERQFGDQLNELASLRSELANYKAKSEGLEIQAKALQDSVINHHEIIDGLKSELAEKEKKIEVLLKYESERDLFIFEQQHKIEELQKICEAADKVIESYQRHDLLFNSGSLQTLKESLKVYDQLKNTKP